MCDAAHDTHVMHMIHSPVNLDLDLYPQPRAAIGLTTRTTVRSTSTLQTGPLQRDAVLVLYTVLPYSFSIRDHGSEVSHLTQTFERHAIGFCSFCCLFVRRLASRRRPRARIASTVRRANLAQIEFTTLDAHDHGVSGAGFRQ